LRQKNYTFPIFKKFKSFVKNQTGRLINKLMTNNGFEFCDSEFTEFCTVNSTARHKILVGKPQQSKVAECINRTLLEKAHCILSDVGLWGRITFWAEAVSSFCYLVNRSPHTSIDFNFRFQKKFG